MPYGLCTYELRHITKTNNQKKQFVFQRVFLPRLSFCLGLIKRNDGTYLDQRLLGSSVVLVDCAPYVIIFIEIKVNNDWFKNGSWVLNGILEIPYS